MEKFELLEEEEFGRVIDNKDDDLYFHICEALRAYQRAGDFLDEAKKYKPRIFKQAHEQFIHELMGYDW